MTETTETAVVQQLLSRSPRVTLTHTCRRHARKPASKAAIGQLRTDVLMAQSPDPSCWREAIELAYRETRVSRAIVVLPGAATLTEWIACL